MVSKVDIAVAAVLYGALSGLAIAAEASADADGLEEVVVTGSNIRRADMEKIVPITVIDEEAMETRNAVLPAELLTSLPSVVSLPQNESRLGSSGARGDNANVNLRNLGATATLILIDGRRMAINPMTAGLSQAVNINQLPTHGIERIEVLRDGASSIYGSDAVGGVINFVLKREMEGVEASARYDRPEAGGGESLQGSLAFGSTFRGRSWTTVRLPRRPQARRSAADRPRFQPFLAEHRPRAGRVQCTGRSVRPALDARLLPDLPSGLHRHIRHHLLLRALGQRSPGAHDDQPDDRGQSRAVPGFSARQQPVRICLAARAARRRVPLGRVRSQRQPHRLR